MKGNSMNTVERMVEEIKQELSNGDTTIEEIEDREGEFVDSYLPIYNNEIIKEWQDMPSEYDNQGAAELGYAGHETDIINLMSLDLYLYYGALFQEAMQEVRDSIEEQVSV